MSIEAENVDHDITVKDLLERILEQLNLIRIHQEIITGEIINREDIE